MASPSAGPKGGRSPGARSSLPAVHWPRSTRRPWRAGAGSRPRGRRPAAFSVPPGPRPGNRRVSLKSVPPARRGRARSAPGRHRAVPAGRPHACAWPTCAGVVALRAPSLLQSPSGLLPKPPGPSCLPSSNAATTRRLSTLEKPNSSEVHSVGIGGRLCYPVTLCCRRIIPDSEPRCTQYREISGLVFFAPTSISCFLQIR